MKMNNKKVKVEKPRKKFSLLSFFFQSFFISVCDWDWSWGVFGVYSK